MHNLLFLLLFTSIITSCKNDVKQPKSIKDLMHERYTVRSFDPTKDVEKKDLDQILSAGLMMPSKRNFFPYDVIALTTSKNGRTLTKELWKNHSKSYHCRKDGTLVKQYIHSIKDAPVNLLFFTDPDKELEDNLIVDWDDQHRRATRDAMVAVTTMLIQAEQLGYNTAFTGIFNPNDQFKEKLGLTKRHRPLVILSIGHALPIKSTKPKNPPGIVLDFDCKGEPQKTKRFIWVKNSEDKRKWGVTRSVDIGNKKRKVRLERAKIF